MEQWAAGEHPDANVLCALAEGTLTQRERAQVLVHLSACGDCREAVALAMPEIPASAPAAASASTSWMRWPMLRWAGVATAMVVVAAAVVMHRSRTVTQGETTTNYSAPSAARSGGQRADQPPAVNQEKTEIAAETRSAAPLAAPRKEEVVERRKGKKDGVAAPAGGVGRNRMDAGAPSNAPMQDQIVRAPKAVMPTAPAAEAKSAAAIGGAVAVQKAGERPAMAAVQESQISRDSAAALEVQAGAGQAEKKQDLVLNRRANAAGAAGQNRSMMKTAVSTEPHWRISAEGALERSTDAGQTWRFVRVGEPETMLRSFSSVGHDLWAGGNAGALYHSPDNGRTWARVTVKAGDEVLRSDIARVEFTDPQNGAVTTMTGEIWTTSDGGVTWMRR